MGKAMERVVRSTSGGKVARGLALMALSALVAGCSASKALNSKGLFGGEKTVAAATPASVEEGSADGVRVGFCPKVQLITNDETYRTFEGRDRSIDNIEYQASLYDVTRSCRVDGDRLIIDVSAAGRLLAGPKGNKGGAVSMPIRVAVKDKAGVPYSDLETYKASIDANATTGQFIYRRSTVSIPVTSDRSTTVLIGFDEGAPKRS